MLFFSTLRLYKTGFDSTINANKQLSGLVDVHASWPGNRIIEKKRPKKWCRSLFLVIPTPLRRRLLTGSTLFFSHFWSHCFYKFANNFCFVCGKYICILYFVFCIFVVVDLDLRLLVACSVRFGSVLARFWIKSESENVNSVCKLFLPRVCCFLHSWVCVKQWTIMFETFVMIIIM